MTSKTLYKASCLAAIFCHMLLLTPALEAAERLKPKGDIEIPFVGENIKVDAVLDEEVWQRANRLLLDNQTQPGNNIPAPVRTEVLLAENGSELFVAFRAFDPEPEKIKAYLRDRDSAYHDDFAGIILDTFNDQKKAFKFFVNALGSQMDILYDEIRNTEDDSWNANWRADGKITDVGYTLEMAIPLNILRFHSGLKEQVWGIDIIRFRPRKHRENMSINYGDRAISCYLCQLRKASGFSNAKPSRNLEAAASLVSISSESRESGLSPSSQNHTDVDTGLDIRWGINPATTLNVTINPDFSQVEADAIQLDVNTTFSLFLPERRPFFLDSINYFQSMNQLFYTRNITEPNVGVKLTNNLGANTTGIIFTDDEETLVTVPRFDRSDVLALNRKSQNAVFRYQHGFGTDSAIGAVVTARQAQDYENLVFGIDGKYRFNTSNAIKFQLLNSETENPDAILGNDNNQNRLNLSKKQRDTAINLRFDHRSTHWRWHGDYQKFGKDFRADLGFITRVDFESFDAGLYRFSIGEEKDWWSFYEVGGKAYRVDRSDGQMLEQTLEGSIDAQAALSSSYKLTALTQEQFFEGINHKQNRISFNGKLNLTPDFQLGWFVSKGGAIDFDNNRPADLLQLDPFLEWNIGRSLQIRLDMKHQKLDISEGRLFKAESADLRVTYQFSNRSRLRISMRQTTINRRLELYNSPGNFDKRFSNLDRQLLYSYKLTPQTVFFLGFSDSDRRQLRLQKSEKENWSVFLKLRYAWQPK